MNDNTLLNAVQRLTNAYYDRKIIIDDDPDHGTDRQVVASLKRDGLLKQLRTAIVGGIGSHEGAAPGRERIPFDTGAVELYDSIEKDITKRFVNLLQKPVFLELEKNLTEWYLEYTNQYRAGKISAKDYDHATATVESWCRKIEGHFDKPRQLEVTVHVWERDETGAIVMEDIGGRQKPKVAKRLPAPCPVCGEAYARVPKTGDQVFALVLEYREIGPETIDKATGLCRFCEQVWKAGSGLRQLAWSVEQEEIRLNTPA